MIEVAALLSYLCSLRALLPFFSCAAHVTLRSCRWWLNMSLIDTEANIHTACRELSSPFYQEVLWDLALRRLLGGPAQSDKKNKEEHSGNKIKKTHNFLSKKMSVLYRIGNFLPLSQFLQCLPWVLGHHLLPTGKKMWNKLAWNSLIRQTR